MYSGLTGKLNIKKEGDADFTTVAYISNWSVEDTADIIEITQLGVDSKDKISGLQSWSPSADGAVSFESGKDQSLLFEAKRGGKPVTVQMFLFDKTKGILGAEDVYFEGAGYIESLSVDLSAEDKGNISISISGSDELKLMKGNIDLYKNA